MDQIKKLGAVCLAMGCVSPALGDGGVACALSAYRGHVEFGSGVPGDFEARAMVVRDGIAYVAADESGLQIFDVSDPSSMVLLSQTALGGVAQGIDLYVGSSVTIAFVACGDGGVRIVRVTDPASPAFPFVSSISLADARDVAVLPPSFAGEIVIGVAAGSEGYRAFDVSTVFPSLVEFEFGSDVARSIDVQAVGGQTYIYVAAGSAGVDVYTPGNTAADNLITTLSTPGFAGDAAVVGDVLYVADGSSGVEAIELLPDRSGGTIEDNIPIDSFARKVAADGDRLYVIEDRPKVSVVNIEDPTSPDVIGEVRSLGQALSVGASGTDVFIGTRDSGMIAVDTGDLDALNTTAELGSYEWTDGNVSNPHTSVVVGDTLYVPREKLEIFDVSAGAPALVGSFDTGGYVRSVDVADGVAYAVDGVALSVIDVSDPSSPALLGSVATTGGPAHVLVDGAMAYIADTAEGMKVVDVSDPSAPVVIGTYATASNAKRVLYVGDSVFMRIAHVLTEDSVEVVSLLEETTPVALGPGISLEGSLLFGAVSDGVRLDQLNFDFDDLRYRLRSIDVSNPLLPSVIDESGAAGFIIETIKSGTNDPMIERSGDTVSFSTGETGVVLFDVSDPGALGFLGVFSGSAMSWTSDETRGYLRVPGSLRVYDMSACAPECAADLNGDGALDFFDLSEFLSLMLDWDGSTTFDFFDLSGYLQAFGEGCP